VRAPCWASELEGKSRVSASKRQDAEYLLWHRLVKLDRSDISGDYQRVGDFTTELD